MAAVPVGRVPTVPARTMPLVPPKFPVADRSDTLTATPPEMLVTPV